MGQLSSERRAQLNAAIANYNAARQQERKQKVASDISKNGIITQQQKVPIVYAGHPEIKGDYELKNTVSYPNAQSTSSTTPATATPKYAGDFISTEFTPNYADMTPIKAYTSNGQVVGAEDAMAGMSYNTTPTSIEEFRSAEKGRYKNAVIEALKTDANERARQINRANELRKAMTESGGRLTGADLQEYYTYFPQERGSLNKAVVTENASAFDRNIKAPILAGIRQGGLIGAMRNNEDISAYGESQFDSSMQKGLYNFAKTGAYVADIATLGKYGEYMQGVGESARAYEAAKGANSAWRGMYNLGRVGQAGGIVNTLVKTGGSIAFVGATSYAGYKIGESYAYGRRNLGIDLKQKTKEYNQEEKLISGKVGLATGTLAANTGSQLVGSTYLMSDVSRNAGTILNRFKDVAAAGAGEGTAISFISQESLGGQTHGIPYLYKGGKSNLRSRALEVGGVGAIGAITAGSLDFLMSGGASKTILKKAPRSIKTLSEKGTEVWGYATDRYEYFGDLTEKSLRGGFAFEKPVRINTQTDFAIPKMNVNLKTNANTNTNLQTFKSRVGANSLVNVNSLTNTNTNSLINTNALVNTNTNSLVNTNTNVLVNTNTNSLVNTHQNSLVNTNTNPLVNTNTNTNTNTLVDTNTNTDTDTNTDTNVFVPTGGLPPFFPVLIGGGGGSSFRGFSKGGKTLISKYKPSLLGIASGKKATKTGGLTGLEVRGVEKPLQQKTPKSFKFGGLELKPTKKGLGMKIKVSKSRAKSEFGGSVGSYFRKAAKKGLI